MEINSVSVKYWKYFDFDKDLQLKPGINLILGKNGSGKTSFLRMIQDAATNQPQNLSGLDPATTDGTNLVTISMSEGANTISLINQKAGGNGNWATNTLNGKVRYITSQRSITSGNNARNPLVQNLGDISISVPNQTIDVAEEFNKAIIKELFDKVSELTKSTGFLSDLEKAYQDELIDFEKTLKIDPTRENAVYFVDYKDREVSVNDLSSGEKEYLYFYAFLRRIKADEGNIVLIDEPELHLHSSQIRKLCELISTIALKNQVVIATHSGEVLQHFISRANIVLLSKGTVDQISDPDAMRKVLEETGLPIDPSVFTAHWICAENEPSKTLPGGGATTPEALEWIFGKSLKKRYWSFGSNRAVAQAYGSGIATTGATGVAIDVTVILDGDKLIKAPTDYFSVAIPEPKKDIAYFPFWELENIFLTREILDAAIHEKDKKNGSAQFWELMEANKAELLKTVIKTVAKNSLRDFSLDSYINNANPVADIESWKQAVQGSAVDLSNLDTLFNQVIAQKKWQWLPGKEAMGLLVGKLATDFWVTIRTMQHKNEIATLLEKDAVVKDFVAKVNALI
jgi:ABC-type multidrug transport system ATPase subunit